MPDVLASQIAPAAIATDSARAKHKNAMRFGRRCDAREQREPASFWAPESISSTTPGAFAPIWFTQLLYLECFTCGAPTQPDERLDLNADDGGAPVCAPELSLSHYLR